MVGAAERPIDFFISRAGADAAFGDRIGRILEDAGHGVFLQQWEFANRNFMDRMHAALTSGARVIALLSNDYLASDHCAAEWQNAIAHDPLNRQARLVVMRVDECAPTGLLTALAYWDLVPIRAGPRILRDVVLAAVEPGRHKGEATPGARYWREARAVVHPDIKATPSFTGRETELAAIDAALGSGGAAAVTQPAAVHGLGGIGKSVLAREYAYRNQERYAGAWWLNAAKPDDAAGFDGIETALVDLGALFIRDLDQARDRAAAARKALEFSAHGGFEKPWLLVYDNVDDTRALREWAPLGNAQVLATSRLGGWSKTVGTIEIETWPSPDAIRYLLYESGRDDLTDDDARAIAEALGCLPLALSHAAAYLRARTNVTAEQYVDTLAQRMREAPKDADYPNAVFATLQENADQAETEVPGARAVLSLAAFYAPDAIPEELFQQPAACYPPALAALIADTGVLDDAIGALSHLSLIDFDPAGRVFSVHRLAQAAARDAVGDEAGTWAESALRAAFAAFPDPEFKTWSVCERLVDHARAVASYVTSDSQALGVILGRAGAYLQERAALSDVLPLYERSRQVFANLTKADPDQGEWQQNLGVSNEHIGRVLMAQGDITGALKAFEAKQAITSRLAAANPSNKKLQRDLTVSHNKVGDVLLVQGKGDEALALYEKTNEILLTLVAAEPGDADWQRDMLVSHNKLGDLLLQHGNGNEALKHYCDSLKIAESLAAAHPNNAERQRDVFIGQSKLADILLERGDLAAAEEAYQKVLATSEHLAATDPSNANWQRDLSVSHEKMGDALVAQGKGDEALASYRASLDIRDRLAAADPANAERQYGVALSLQRIGLIAAGNGERDEALAACQRGLRITQALVEMSLSHAAFGRVHAWFEARIAELGE